MKLYKSYRKYLLKRDTFFATISVFLTIGLLAFIPFNTKVLNPIKTALVDFDFNDIAYAKLGKNSDTRLDEHIVIVNVGTADRAQIGGIIEAVNSANPSVIGLDVEFNGPREPASDAMLLHVLQNTPNVVGASRLNWKETDQSVEQRGYYANALDDFGYVNFIGEDKGTIRYFSPVESVDKQQYQCFAAAMVERGDAQLYKKIAARHRNLEKIHFKRRAGQYLVIDGNDVLEGRVAADYFKDKFVLLGYVNASPNDVEDKHYTPMNASFAGKALPDMNGVVIHANILSMMLDNSYVRKLPAWLNCMIITGIAWLLVTLFIRYYIEDYLWFHLAAKVAQILSAILFVFISIMLFHWFGLELDMKIPLIVILLAVDVIYFYEAFALWLNKKYGYRTIFNHKKH